MTILQIMAGGALGAGARGALGLWLPGPWTTLAVNVAGCFAIGLLWSSLGRAHPFLVTGLLGGFTTFSAFSLDALRLLDEGRTATALSYVAASVALSLAAVALGARAAA
ncbi:MAG: fluoride efflux transporter FluC [Paracoccaceae bacterium]